MRAVLLMVLLDAFLAHKGASTPPSTVHFQLALHRRGLMLRGGDGGTGHTLWRGDDFGWKEGREEDGGEEEEDGTIGAGLGEDSEVERALVGMMQHAETDDDKLTETLVAALVKSGVSDNDQEACEEVISMKLEEMTATKWSERPAEEMFSAQARELMGDPVMSANWTCLRCGTGIPPYWGECYHCGMMREEVEFLRDPETVVVRVPEDTKCISAAVNKTQQGLTILGWNQKYRSGLITLSSASSWPFEIQIASNMSLSIVSPPTHLPGEAKTRWWMQEASHGNCSRVSFSYYHTQRAPFPVGVPHPLGMGLSAEEEVKFWCGMHPQYECDPELDMVHSTIDVWGGPWVFDDCSIKAADAIALSTAEAGDVVLNNCDMGGIDEEDGACVSGIDLAGTSLCTAERCTIAFSVCGGCGMRVMCDAKGVLRGCNVTAVDFGVCVDLAGHADLENCTFLECVWGTWYVGFDAQKTGMRIVDCYVPSGPAWYDERRPGNLQFERVSVNDTVLVELRDWQEFAKKRHAQGHRDGWLERHVITERGGHAWKVREL